jgi:hypothetical protein
VNRLPSALDLLIMLAIVIIFVLGCLKTGELLYHGFAAVAAWVFP